MSAAGLKRVLGLPEITFTAIGLLTLFFLINILGIWLAAFTQGINLTDITEGEDGIES